MQDAACDMRHATCDMRQGLSCRHTSQHGCIHTCMARHATHHIQQEVSSQIGHALHIAHIWAIETVGLTQTCMKQGVSRMRGRVSMYHVCHPHTLCAMCLRVRDVVCRITSSISLNCVFICTPSWKKARLGKVRVRSTSMYENVFYTKQSTHTTQQKQHSTAHIHQHTHTRHKQNNNT